MATKYSKGLTAKPNKTLYNAGEALQSIVAVAPIAAADNDGDLYVLARGVSLDWTVVSIWLAKAFSAVTSGTDFDIGIYKNTGTLAVPVWTEVDKDCFVDGKNLSAGGTSALDILESDTSKTIAEILEITSEVAQREYAIVLTANTVGSATVDVEFIINVATAH